MNEELLLAVQEADDWLPLFERRTYKKAFLKYRARFSGAFAEMFRVCATEEMLKNSADWMLTEMEKDWKRRKFWNRSAARIDQKQMLLVYLSPMLLSMEEPAGRRFAELLRDGWAERRPKDVYEITTFEKLMKGFHNVILGIDLTALNREEDDDE